jgi:hypothetical protein
MPRHYPGGREQHHDRFLGFCGENQESYWSSTHKEKIMSGDIQMIKRPSGSIYEKPCIAHEGELKQFAGSPLRPGDESNAVLGLPGGN